MPISMAADYPDKVAGVVYGLDTVVRRLREVGCAVRETRAATPDDRAVAGGAGRCRAAPGGRPAHGRSRWCRCSR